MIQRHPIISLLIAVVVLLVLLGMFALVSGSPSVEEVNQLTEASERPLHPAVEPLVTGEAVMESRDRGASPASEDGKVGRSSSYSAYYSHHYATSPARPDVVPVPRSLNLLFCVLLI